MRGKAQTSVSELFNQAVQTFETAMKTGVRIQEEASKWWTDMLGEANSLQELQQRARQMINETLPTSQQNADQYIKLLDKTYHTSMGLLQKAFETGQSESISEAQTRIQELWESMLSAIRNNAQAMVQINAKAMESWSEFAQRDVEEMASEMRSASRSGSQQMQSAMQAGSQQMKSAASSMQAARPRTKAASRPGRTARAGRTATVAAAKRRGARAAR